jgi:hypothetical protein
LAKDGLKEMQTPIGTVNSEELRARRRAELAELRRRQTEEVQKRQKS